jgi:hypothetical protein
MIRAINYVPEEAKKQAETQALGSLMNVFTEKMVQRLMEGVSKGKTGWDAPESMEKLRESLLVNLKAADWVDVATIAMMLWNLEQS